MRDFCAALSWWFDKTETIYSLSFTHTRSFSRVIRADIKNSQKVYAYHAVNRTINAEIFIRFNRPKLILFADRPIFKTANVILERPAAPRACCRFARLFLNIFIETLRVRDVCRALCLYFVFPVGFRRWFRRKIITNEMSNSICWQ